jgi:hypothetical protein
VLVTVKVYPFMRISSSLGGICHRSADDGLILPIYGGYPIHVELLTQSLGEVIRSHLQYNTVTLACQVLIRHVSSILMFSIFGTGE